MRITVCGAGPAGIGMACCLMKSGHQVMIYEMPEYADRLVSLHTSKQISCHEKVEFCGELLGATDNAAEAIKDADVLFIATHAAAHKKLAALFQGHFRPDQIVVMSPGYVGGGVEFTQTLRDMRAPVIPQYIELSSLPIISMFDGPNTVKITGWKRNFLVYCPEALMGHEIMQWLYDLYAPLKVTGEPLEPGLNEINFIVHAVVSILNVNKVESGSEWKFYRDGLTPSIVRVIEKIDQERTELEKALGLREHRLTDLLSEFYANQGMSSENLYTQLTTFAPFAAVNGPNTFDNRFISEDLCYGLVPMIWLGEQKGLPMEATRMIIQLASVYTGSDYLREGRKVVP